MKANSPTDFSSDVLILNKRYIIQNKLGDGKTSIVYKIKDLLTGEIKAAKIFDNNMKEEFEREVHIFKKISEIDIPSNIKYFESGIGSLTQKNQSLQKMFIILEYGNHGSLFDVLFKLNTGFSEEVCQLILLNIINAVEALHKKGICHRDIKPENMLFVGDNYDLKLCDFGYSTSFWDENKQKIFLRKTCGTISYCAPELFEGKKYDGEKIDIFSIGAILFILMNGKMGFLEATENDALYNNIKSKQYDKYWDILENRYHMKIMPEKFKKLYVKMIAYKPEERLTISEIRQDEWLKDIQKLNEEQLNLLRKKMIKLFMSVGIV